MTHSKKEHNLYTTRQEVKPLSARRILCCWNKEGTSKQLTVDMSGCNNWTHTHTLTHIQSAITQVGAQRGRSDAKTLNHAESSKSWVEKLTWKHICLLRQCNLNVFRMRTQHFIYMDVQDLMICTFISLYFCCKVSPVSAVLWGCIKVMHLLMCRRTGVEKKNMLMLHKCDMSVLDHFYSLI